MLRCLWDNSLWISTFLPDEKWVLEAEVTDPTSEHQIAWPTVGRGMELARQTQLLRCRHWEHRRSQGGFQPGEEDQGKMMLTNLWFWWAISLHGNWCWKLFPVSWAMIITVFWCSLLTAVIFIDSPAAENWRRGTDPRKGRAKGRKEYTWMKRKKKKERENQGGTKVWAKGKKGDIREKERETEKKLLLNPGSKAIPWQRGQCKMYACCSKRGSMESLTYKSLSMSGLHSSCEG